MKKFDFVVKHLCPTSYITALGLSFMSQPGLAGVTLTGLLHQGAEIDGFTAGSPIWNTLGYEPNFANIYVTEPNSGPYAPFITHGNADQARISYDLTPGTYTFYFFSAPFYPDNYRPQYGLNLFFEGDDTNPGIAVFGPSEATSATPVPAGTLTLSLNGDNFNKVPSPGTLTYIANGLSVTLTEYGFGRTGNFLIPAIDRVRNIDDAPEGDIDGIGIFTLEVAVIPEPTTLALLGLGSLALVMVRRRR